MSDLFWIKFPKVGSSFATTVVGFACGAPIEVTTKHGIHVPPACNRTRVGAVLAPEHRSIPKWFERPVVWRDKEPLHAVVALFRDPISRRHSEFHYLSENLSNGRIQCCGFLPWALKGRVAAILGAPGPIEARLGAYIRFTHAYQGCMTNMLLGRGCFAGTPSSEMVARAVRMVETDLAFVGLQERWNATVQLWHRRYGGPTFANEIGGRHVTTAEQRAKLPHDDVDAAVYLVATRRFEADQRRFASLHSTS